MKVNDSMWYRIVVLWQVATGLRSVRGVGRENELVTYKHNHFNSQVHHTMITMNTPTKVV